MMRSFVRSIKKGMIILWSVAIVDIPGGWVLCDGNNGTPDLRNRFVLAAGDTYAVDALGGAVLHSHPANETHTHMISSGADIASGSGYNASCDSPVKAGVTGNADNLPPYHALAYIMKL